MFNGECSSITYKVTIMSTLNNNVKINTISAMLFNNGMLPHEALVLSTALIQCELDLDQEWFDLDVWKDLMSDNMYVTVLSVTSETTESASGFEIENWFDKLVHANLMTEEGVRGSKLLELGQEIPKSYPRLASDGVAFRRKPVMPGKPKMQSKLLTDAIDVLQSTEYVVDSWMLRLIDAVYGTGENAIKHDDEYVVEGCRELVAGGNLPHVAEFFADRRARLYQGDCHGPNGQSSDIARALQDLSGVGTDYHIPSAIKIVQDEIADMHSGDLNQLRELMVQVGLANFVAQCLTGQLPQVKKPWSFVKAVNILNKLELGGRPYIGMAFGLDAKCSGPQLGALMTGDKTIANACGFATAKAERDAYELCIQKFEEKGFYGLTRALIKKPYMGVFYGQKAGAFASVENYGDSPKQADPALLAFITSMTIKPKNDESALEAQAKAFVAIIESSFGLMQNLRKTISNAHYEFVDGQRIMKTSKATSYFMPDGVEVAMKKYIKVNVLNETVEYGMPKYTTQVECNGIIETFEDMCFSTKEVDLYDFARSGFVNMIQATDALLARLIVTHLDALGAQHVIAVHDCFRVNINDMIEGKLHEAIRLSYLDMFASETNEKTGYLRMGTDILGSYFMGVEAAGAPKVNNSCFTYSKTKDAYVRKISRGFPLVNMINDMQNALEGTGRSYFFAK